MVYSSRPIRSTPTRSQQVGLKSTNYPTHHNNTYPGVIGLAHKRQETIVQTNQHMRQYQYIEKK